MSALRQLQQAFMQHLLGTPSSIIEHIQSSATTSAEQRLKLYSQGYRLRLKEAIISDYDCLHGYLGDDMFEQLMDHYIDQYPSKHPSLRYYSQQIPALLAKQSPFSEYPESLEIAQIEQAFNDSFDAANCTPLSINYLAEIQPEAWPILQIKLHASVQLINCQTNSFPIWKALSEEQTPPKSTKDTTTWLIWRKDLVSRYRALDDAESHALSQVLKGSDFGEICSGLLNYFDEEQTPLKAVGYLQTWMNDLMVCDIYSSSEEKANNKH